MHLSFASARPNIYQGGSAPSDNTQRYLVPSTQDFREEACVLYIFTQNQKARYLKDAKLESI